MPSLRIPFPDKDQPSVITLRADRITIGRHPDNTIQIPDRTVSAHHAEIIAENGHYRVHDLGATNGILVNGQVISDFHLSEACKVTFGSVECEFSPETPQEEAADPARTLITRSEAEALQSEIATLRSQVAAFQQESETLRKSHEAPESTATVPQPEFDRVTSELTAMTLRVVDTERQLAQVKSEVAVLRRDRENLQKALDDATVTPQAGISQRHETPASEPAADALPVVDETPTASEGAELASVEDAPTQAAPVQAPLPRPKPAFVPSAGAAATARPVMPFPSAQPKAPGQVQPAGTVRSAQAGSGLRPAAFAKPTAAPGGQPSAPATYQGKPGLAAKAGIPTKPSSGFPKAVPPGARPVAATPAGPKGTQKLG